MHYLPECVSSMLILWMNSQSYKSSMHQLPECNLYHDELGWIWIALNQGMHYLVTESFAAKSFAASNFAARSFTADSFAVDSFAASSFAARQFRPKPVSPRTVSPRIVSPRAVLLGPPPWNRFFRHFRLFWARKKIFFLVQKFFLDLKNFQEKKIENVKKLPFRVSAENRGLGSV